MPSIGNPFIKGHLYLAFHVKFPATLEASVVKQIKQLLPEPNMEVDYDPEVVEEHFLDVADLRHFGKGGAAVHSSEYDSDEEGGGQGVQCQQS
jgi:DnaJ family protein A protein 2